MAKMKYTDFREVVNSLPDCKDFEHFVAERGWQEWMLNYFDDENNNRVVEVLAAIWELRDSPIRGIKNVAKLSNEKLSRAYGIPIHSIENWLSETRGECPKYVWQMLAYCAFSDYGVI